MTAATALRLLLHRRAGFLASPSQVLLQPLFSGMYSKLRSSLPAATGAVAGLLEVYRAQAPQSQSLVPSLFRHHSSKPKHTLQSTTAAVAGLHGKYCILSSQPIVPSLIRNYSSNGERCCNTYTETEVLVWILEGVQTGMSKRLQMLTEIAETIRKSTELLKAGLLDEAYAMYEKSFVDTLKFHATYGKDLDDLTRGFGSIKGIIQLDTLEQHRILCQELEELLKSMRQTLKELAGAIEKQKILEKINKWLKYANVGLGACAGILLLILLFLHGYF